MNTTELTYTDFLKFKESLQGLSILHLGHRDADCDALGSAYAMSQVIPGDIGFMDSMKTSAHDLSEWLEIHPIINPHPENYDLTIIYDTPFYDLLGTGLPPDYAIIDHHKPKELKFVMIQEQLIKGSVWHLIDYLESTCSILVELFKANQIELTHKMQVALAAGIVTDTSWLMRANADALTRLASILQPSGLYLGDIIEAIDSPERRNMRRQAVLSALCKVRTVQVGTWSILATATDNHDHGFAVASALYRLGGDISVVAFPKAGNSMVLIESHEAVTNDNRIDISKITTQIALSVQAKDFWSSPVRGRVVADLPEDRLLDVSIEEIQKALSEQAPVKSD